MGSPLTFQGPGATAQAEVPWPATHCPSLLTPVLFCTLRILSYQVQTTQDIIKALFTPTENSAPHPLHPLDLGWYKLEAWSDPGNVDSGKTTQVGRNSRPPGTRGDKGFWWACCTTSSQGSCRKKTHRNQLAPMWLSEYLSAFSHMHFYQQAWGEELTIAGKRSPVYG